MKSLSKYIPEAISEPEIIHITDKEEMKKYADEIWDILQESCKNIGGFKSYSNIKQLIKGTKLISLIKRNGNVSACRIYRDIEGSFKFNGSGANTKLFGQEAKHDLEIIVKHDAENGELYRWGEVSGAIEHWMKKHGGFPIPNIYAPELLPNSKSIVDLDSDGHHYVRRIGKDGEEYTKCIYGFKNPDLIEKLYDYWVSDSFEDYPEFRDYANSLPTPKNESLLESDAHKLALRKWAISVIQTIYEFHEYGMNEMPDSIYKLFNKAFNILLRDDQTNKAVKSNIEDAQFIQEFVPRLRFHIGVL